MFIDDIHKHWFADYDKLEDNHTYIQWYVVVMPPLFLKEDYFNFHCQHVLPECFPFKFFWKRLVHWLCIPSSQIPGKDPITATKIKTDTTIRSVFKVN